MDSQEDIVRKVQGLWAVADDPATPAEARESYIIKARELMAKYAIDEIVLSQQTSNHEEIIMADILLYEEDEEDISLVPDQRMTLAHVIAINSRCKCIVSDKDASIYADGKVQLAGTYMLVYGFRSDVRLVESLYTNIMSDMILSFYRTEFRKIKKASQQKNAMVNFCVGYVRRIRQRLAEIDKTVHQMAEADGSLLPVLRGREDAVKDHFDQMYPPDSLTKLPVRGYTPDAGAQDAGAAAANMADLGATKIDSGSKGALGS